MSERFPGGFITKTSPVPTLTSASGIWTAEQAMEYQKAGTWPYGGPFNYIEDVFSTWLIKTPGSTTAVGAVNNSIDLSTKGGMVWLKDRNFAYDHTLVDTARGATQRIRSNTTNAQASTSTYGFTSFNTNGFTLGDGGGVLFDNGASGTNVVTWTFRKQTKFFDVVTYTGNGVDGRAISHNLGAIPRFIIVKRTDAAAEWRVYAYTPTGPQSFYLALNTTGADGQVTGGYVGDPSATTFPVYQYASNISTVNANGGTYVAYLFASNAGGFGLTGTDNVISCGSFTGSATSADITLGYEPQWILYKQYNSAAQWNIVDNMRGLPETPVAGNYARGLYTNTTGVEDDRDDISPTATGFKTRSNSGTNQYIYIAIRRGPMKVPTTGTSVFKPVTRAGTGTSAYSVTGTGFSPDSIFIRSRNNAAGKNWNNFDRLRGIQNNLVFGDTSAEASNTDKVSSYDQDGYSVPATPSPTLNATGENFIDYLWKRAPSFMDVVCYTGTGTASQVLTHNLTVIPTLTIFKKRSAINPWDVVSGNTSYMQLNATNAATPDTSIAATSTTITAALGAGNGLNASGATYVAYLFATCAGVSKVGSYTGNGSSQTINCGFTGGARFILIKRTDSTGDWYVWDTARGIVAGNDPYLGLNTYVNEVTTNDTIDPDNSGFIVNQLAATNVNVTSATYIFLAIA